MARGSRSSGRSGGSGGSRAGGGRARGGGSRQQTTKGQVRDGKVVQYAVKGKSGATKYVGTTNNPTRRAAQHQQSGKMQPGDSLEVQSRPLPRGKAENLESGRLKGHRQAQGRNPQHNTTNDGKYHPRARS